MKLEGNNTSIKAYKKPYIILLLLSLIIGKLTLILKLKP